MSFSPYDTLRPEILRPLPQPLRGVACVKCDKPQSSWWSDLQSEEDKTYVCALCMLYDSKWGRDCRESIEEVILRIQQVRGKAFDRTASKRLIHVRDADDVLGVMVLADRTVGIHRMATEWKGGR